MTRRPSRFLVSSFLPVLVFAACTDSSSARDAQAPAIPSETDASISVPDVFTPPAVVPDRRVVDALELALPCNGSPAYCEKRYDELCQAATHDSAANSGYWQTPSQDRSLRFQLENSVRVFMLNVMGAPAGVSVCKADCEQGITPLATVLTTVKEFLDGNPRDVVTLIIDSVLPASQLAAEFVTTKLDILAHTQALQAPWPNLAAMIASGHRLVVLSSSTEGGPAWLLPRQAFIWETAARWTSLPAMTCNPVEGAADRPLYLVHHDLVETPDAGEEGQPSLARAAEANAFPVALARLQQCKNQFGRAPNYLALDFFEIGDAQGATMVLNGVRADPAGTR